MTLELRDKPPRLHDLRVTNAAANDPTFKGEPVNEDSRQAWRSNFGFRYYRLSEFPSFLLAVVYFGAFIILLDPNTADQDRAIARHVLNIVWIILIIDFAIRIISIRKRVTFLRQNWMLAVALIFPPLRILLLAHAIRLMNTRAKGTIGHRVGLYTLFLTTLVVLIGSVLVVSFEATSPKANITSLGDSLWWAMETISTVGYGDFYPVTVPGRVIAVLLFINGIGLLSVVTAQLASKVVKSAAAEKTPDAT
jgi:voltage-gated potassium channel